MEFHMKQLRLRLITATNFNAEINCAQNGKMWIFKGNLNQIPCERESNRRTHSND